MNSQVANATELFVDPAAGNYQLLENSIAINAGTGMFAPLGDIASQPRPAGTAIDIGAYERPGAVLTGDYNRDGAIDAADFTAWRDTLGATVAAYSGADGDGSGQIGPGDHAVWKTNFGAAGESSFAARTMPEPASIALIGMLLLAPGLRRLQLRRQF